MVKAVRGEGLLLGVEFTAPASLRLRIPFEAFMTIHPAMFGQIVVMRLFRDHGILTQVCGNNFMVLKVAPPLVVTDGQIDQFVLAIKRVRIGAFFERFLVRGVGPRAPSHPHLIPLGDPRKGVLRPIVRGLYYKERDHANCERRERFSETLLFARNTICRASTVLGRPARETGGLTPLV
jgi:hypothetical protein